MKRLLTLPSLPSRRLRSRGWWRWRRSPQQRCPTGRSSSWKISWAWRYRHGNDLFVVLRPSNSQGHIRTGTGLVTVHSWWLYSATPLGSHAVSTMIWYHTQWHYPDIELTSPCLILIMPSTWLGSDKFKLDKSLVWLDNGFEPTISRTREPCSTDSATASGPWQQAGETWHCSHTQWDVYCRILKNLVSS